MTITAERPILAAAPDDGLTPARAVAFLIDQPGRVLAPAEIGEFVAACWELGELVGIPPAYAFAQSMVETDNGRFPGQVPASAKNVAGIGAINDGTSFLRYPSWRAGWIAYYVHLLAWCGRLEVATRIAPAGQLAAIDPRIPLVNSARAEKGAVTTWRSLGGRWAVDADLPWQQQARRPQNYGWKIEQRYSAAAKAKAMAIKVFLSAGHHNDSGGDQREYGQTGELCEAVADGLGEYGDAFDVKVAQPDGPDPDTKPGDGHLSGSLDVIGNKAVALSRAGWTPNLTLECHTEGGGSTGVFVIYPDDPTRAATDPNRDIDTAVRDRLGPMIAREVAAATGLKVRAGGGIMSERSTGVGAGRSRLGYFRTTAPLAGSTERCIVEYGAHDKEPDVSIQRSPGFFKAAGRGTAKAIAAYYGVATKPAPDGGSVGNVTTNTLRAYGDAKPTEDRGPIFYEGAIDLSGDPFNGGPAEPMIRYQKMVVHQFNGQNFVLDLDLWDELRRDGKIIRWPSGEKVGI